ncbi:MFS transporter (Mch2) [Paracoccidioides lutzii Pb01]|uniref:MFS transporter (Mch2) n=1 Tax=Paracoccidioides lutzii (strain ATCC MYA-826 / Pb01) TaxID=502779 RepID=C1GYF8_PARBA|nr:MFS transporter (Mch2) [Paracoccidioides lutzii Pb01]EEH41549.2 MFS transporter (Mch2) [Paracoccidioides lutzii Pb01]
MTNNRSNDIEVEAGFDSHQTPVELSARQGRPPEEKVPESDITQQSDEGIDDKPPDDAPPDGGYGWVCVACSAWINGNTWGLNSSYAVFLSYYLSHDIFPDASDLTYAFTGGLSMSCCLLVAPLVTHLVHLFGNKPILNVGVVLQTISFIGASFATKQWQLFLSQGVCFGFGMGLLFIGSVGITSQWFLRKRSIATSISAAGSGIGGLIYSLATGSMISRLGLGWTFRILGLITFVVNLIAANLIKDRNKATGSQYKAFHFPLLKRPEFLLLQGWGIFSLLGYVVVLFSLPNFALSIGLTARQGSIVGALLNLGQGLGRPVIGLLSDRYGRLNMATILSIFCGVFCLAVWTPTQSMGLLCFFAIVAGTVAGTFWTTIVPVCAEVVGLQQLPSALSITWVLMVPPTTVSEPIAVLVKDNSKKNRAYLYAQLFAGLAYIVGALCLWVVRAWKVGDNEVAAERKAVADAAIAARTMKIGGDSGFLTSAPVDTTCVPEENIHPSNQPAAAPPVTCTDPIATATRPSIWNPVVLLRSLLTWDII